MKELHKFDEVFDSQKTFRTILEAMANPLREVSIAEASEKMYGEFPHFLAVAMTLLDNEVNYSTCGNQELSDQIRLLTHANETESDEADFIFVTDISQIRNVIEQGNCGTLCDPQDGATIIIADDDLNKKEQAFYGPGIKDVQLVKISSVIQQVLTLRDEQNYEYPQGIDLIFLKEDRSLQCIPRLVRKGV